MFLNRFVASLRARLKQLHPSANSTLREDHMVHVHFKEEIGIAELIPLVTTYIILFAYIYFSTRKRNLYLSSLSLFFLLFGESVLFALLYSGTYTTCPKFGVYMVERNLLFVHAELEQRVPLCFSDFRTIDDILLTCL